MQICDLVHCQSTGKMSFFEYESGPDLKLELDGEQHPKFPGIIILQVRQTMHKINAQHPKDILYSVT